MDDDKCAREIAGLGCNKTVAIDDLAKGQLQLSIEISTLSTTFKEQMGNEPTKIPESKGTGIKGMLCEVIDKLDNVDRKHDELAKKVDSISANQLRNKPFLSTATQKKVAAIITVIVMGIAGAYSQLHNPISANANPNAHAPAPISSSIISK